MVEALSEGDVAVTILLRLLKFKDNYTRGHCERVMKYALEVAQRLGIGPQEIADLKAAALLHDIGKVGIPDSILNKPGRLTQEEFAQIEEHVLIAIDVLQGIPLGDRVITAIRAHHERCDGSGYPDGLRGNQIPLLARILAVADVFDAMTSDRPYRKAMPVSQAIDELVREQETRFDPDVVRALIKYIEATEWIA